MMKGHRCIDYPMHTGKNNAAVWNCDNGPDQKFIICMDGTLRNEAAPNFCMTRTGNGNVVSEQCRLTGPAALGQQWKFGKYKKIKDFAGMPIVAREFIHKETKECLDTERHSGNGDVETNPCGDFDSQYFYFRNRGQLRKEGRLLNLKSSKCLSVYRDSGWGFVGMENCNGSKKQ